LRGGKVEWPLATPKALVAECLAIAVPFVGQIAENQGDLWASQPAAPSFVLLPNKPLRPLELLGKAL